MARWASGFLWDCLQGGGESSTVRTSCAPRKGDERSEIEPFLSPRDALAGNVLPIILLIR